MTTGEQPLPRVAARPDVLRRMKLAVTTFQRELRSSEPAQIVLSAFVGGGVGALVDLMRRIVEMLHKADFLLHKNTLLSSGIGVDRVRIMIVPALGGLLLGLISLWLRRYRHGEIVDPIEANALYGGRMSLFDSTRLALTTMISNAAGASLGMEAGYTQFGAGLFSWVGQYFHLRRADMRVFVTAGAAAAIAAAFNAPLAGAFYGFELVLGSYTPRALAPVAIAAIAATLVERAMGGLQPLFVITHAMPLDGRSYFLFGLMGVFSAGIGVLTMKAVTWSELGIKKVPVPEWMRPAIGGLVLSMIAIYFPQVLGSGHGAIQYHFQFTWAFVPLLALLLAKVIASAISVGTGFRGGLFSSSLFLGCLFGAVFAQAAAYFVPNLGVQYDAFLLVGMGAVAAAIVGAPITMVFLVLEGTGDFPVTVGVLIAVIMSATIVRLTFGYSFATWRFHVRGLGIRGAHDIGWIADLTVGKMMRSDPKLVASDMTLRALRTKYPAGSVKRVFALDPEGHYAGSLDMALVHDPQYDDAIDAGLAADLVDQRGVYLLPGENVRAALTRFDESQIESLPVLAARADPRVVGYMTEAFALRRYAQELERRRSAELGEQDLFSLGQAPRP
ncbi:MAG TPA: chloride channel protein [Rhizomicrobium sp.]|nr:chloride channel protein [Rhizomicrobium sp.]